MEKFANDNLILLEFLVDNICFEYSVQKSLKCMDGETCVAFQFLDNSPLYVCEEDFAPKNRNYADGCGGCSTMKNGKSCLFALNPAQAQQCMKQFDIYVEVFRKMRPGVEPQKMILGESLISILNLFKEMVDAYGNAETEDAPIAKTLKDCFKIQNTSGELVGRIGVYIRMSTFGRLIVTQFQMNLKDKSVEFKAKEGHYLFTTKTKEADAGGKHIMNESLSVKNVLDVPCGKPKENERKPCINEEIRCPRPPPPCIPEGNQGMQNNHAMQVTSITGPPVPCEPQCPLGQCPPPQMNNLQYPPPPSRSISQPQGSECISTCPTRPCQTPNVTQPAQPQAQFQGQCPLCGVCPPQACPACGQTANITPNITPNIAPNITQNQRTITESPCEIYKRQMPTNNIRQETPCNECSDKYQAASVPPPPDCEYQEFGAEMGGNSLIIRVHKDNARVDQLKDESCCCEPGGKPKPAVYQVSQSSPCTCSNQAAGAATRKGGVCPDCCPDNKTPFTFKMGGTTQADNQISVFSPTKNDPSDNKLGTLADPTKEVFILRIGKKNESASKKNNMEIELCTPRGKEFKPPQPKTDTEQQCDAQEVKAEKGKKGKGKKGKGKKGKGKGKKKK